MRFPLGWKTAGGAALVVALGFAAAAEKSRVGGPEATTAVVPRGLVTLRVDLRSKMAGRAGGKAGARAATRWDGSLEVAGGRLHALRLWQEDPRNSVKGSSWELTTLHRIPWNSSQRARGHKAMPLQDGSLVVEIAGGSADTRLDFKTAQGNFSLTLGDLPVGGAKSFLRGLVQIARMASAATILTAPTEDDFAAGALAPDGTLHVAYVAFTHGKQFRRRPPLEKAPEDFSFLAAPTGGDQVMLLTLDGDAWRGPFPVTPPGQDVFRTAAAVDGDGGVWVFWSANRDGNWDLMARRRKGAEWSDPVRLSEASGPDIFPAAATDSKGRVWVAWQGFRGKSFDIFLRGQRKSGFDKAVAVAATAANEWTPAVAAARDGRVAVAWDTYAKGDYDVFCRFFSGGEAAAPIAIAASRRAEMRPSITFDRAGRLWAAYEDAPEKWGKDWGALEKDGVALYQQRSVAVRVVENGKLKQPADDPVNAFQPWRRRSGRRGAGARLAVPRVAADAAGRVWLAVRSPRLGTRVGVGTAWFEHAAFYQGGRWSGEIVCPSTDNLLDNRPALVPRPSGDIALVTSTDGRFATAGRLPQWFVRALRREGRKLTVRRQPPRWPDPVNNELVMAVLGPVPGAAAPPQLVDVAAEKVREAPGPEAQREAADLARVHAARAAAGGKSLKLWRGEFHRHTEISSDGGGDGLLMDMWRYAIDAAGLDWVGNGDHDNGNGREYSWWITQKTTDVFHVAGVFTPMFTYERSCSYPDGHRNVVFARRGVRTLARLRGGRGKAMDELAPGARRPHTPDTQMLYRYLAQFDGVCASHTSGTNMGTDWRDNSARVEPIVEIYQGCRQSYEMPGAPRSNTAGNSLGGWRPFGFVSLALKKGYRLGFQASSDHVSTHISYCNVWVEEPTRSAILAAMKARHVYGSTDNIVADVRCGEHFMGDEFTTASKPRLEIHLAGTRPFASVHIIKDGKYVHSITPHQSDVRLEWTDLDVAAGAVSYYYVRGEQEDGEIVWVSPMWITYVP